MTIGKVAVITGGGKGLGKAFAAALAKQAMHVVLVDVDEALVLQAAEDIRTGGGRATGYVGDVTDLGRMDRIMAQASAIGGGIDVLINNAWLHGHEYGRPISEMGLPWLSACSTSMSWASSPRRWRRHPF